MKISELPDDFTPEQFMKLDRESLDSVPYELKKMMCQCKNCKNGTHVRDYGISPFFLLNRNSKHSLKKPEDYWWNANLYIWLCGKHWLLCERLRKRFDVDHIQRKLMDFSTMPLDKIISIKRLVPSVEKIENNYGKR